jgi:hypothetical protein
MSGYNYWTKHENREIKRDYVQMQLHPKKPETEPPFPPETIKWANSMLNQPSQYELNKDDDYTRTLKQQIVKKDVPQLGTQAKQSIPPQGVIRRRSPAAAASKYG